ncbi:DUF4127 family protein [bacterium]|nr:DUF4127 family protein [bacterium]
MTKMKIAMIPIDNRPVCYSLPRKIASIDSDIELLLPEKTDMGNLKKGGNVENLLSWLKSIGKIDALIVALDTIAYGGLIPSRRGHETFEEIENRLKRFKRLISKDTQVYAFSSIMRISDNNVNEEEKPYWDVYGKKIYEYSYRFHENLTDQTDVPKDIINDYLATRKRNFDVNKIYTKWFEKGFFNTLVYSKDDCSPYGFNVMEADILERGLRNKSKDGKTALIKTGADEIPLSLLARAVVDFNKKQGNEIPKIEIEYLAPAHKHLISNYEDISVEQCVEGQISLTNCVTTEDVDNADMVLLVNNFEDVQGELVMGVDTKKFAGEIKLPEKIFMVADIRFTNGADSKFADKLLKNKLGSNFYGYSAWNTTANTFGSLLCIGLVRYFAQNYNAKNFNTIQFIRFLDDWAYQACVRQIFKKQVSKPNLRALKRLMAPYEKRLKKIFGIEKEIKYSFPWKRFFEIEILFRSKV